ncbi:MAG: HEAT repeat domain-containing protein [Blastocatellia bacterium]|nr:HEAT repeat domain-containing protein [Blastocatellia bacterium]
MEVRDSFDQTIKRMAAYLEQVDGVLILVAVTDDTVLRDHALNELRKRLPAEIDLKDFRYDAMHISLLEGAVEATRNGNGRAAVSVAGLEALSRDKQSEAVKLLNFQRNQLGRTDMAVILWVNRAMLAEISVKAADFYSWRSATLFIEPPENWDKLDSARRSYLQAILYQNEFVNLQGLAPRRGLEIVQMRMDEIFIPLHAEQEVERLGVPPFPYPEEMDMPGVDEEAENVKSAQIMRDVTSSAAITVGENAEEVKPAQGGKRTRRALIEEYGEEQLRDWERHAIQSQREVRLRRVDISELFKERRAVVLGDPGAGKTTLMRYVAYRLAQAQIGGQKNEDRATDMPSELCDCLPVYIRIGEYAQHLKQNPEATLDGFAPLGCQVRQLPLSADLLRDAIRRGRALFLLDGLDEIIDTSQRRDVARIVEQFALAHSQCPVFVTSRVVGYREAQLSGSFSQFTITPFEDDDIRRFAESWYGALNMPQQAEALVKAIDDSPPIRRLASNPLLLTVIALIHHRGTKLPRHRVKLYSQAAETLVDQWMSARRVVPEDWEVEDTIKSLLPAIAWQLHCTTSSGLMRERDLHALLVETMREREARLSEREAVALASQFRRNVNEFSGIFFERGLDEEGRGIYGFLHLTFEEYFAAVRLSDKWEREGDDVLKSVLHDPRWTEIILLAAGHLGESSQYRATRFVEAISGAQSEYENILHRDLLMAARCLGDDIRVDPDLRGAVVSGLLELYFSPESPHSLKEDIRKAFAQLGNTPAEPEIVESLAKRLSDNEVSVRSGAASALGAMGERAASTDVIGALIDRLSDNNVNVRSAAARALKNLSVHVRYKQRPEAAKSFLSLARSNDEEKRDVGYVGLRNVLAARAA